MVMQLDEWKKSCIEKEKCAWQEILSKNKDVKVDTELIRQVRERTGDGVNLCKAALIENLFDVNKACEWLSKNFFFCYA